MRPALQRLLARPSSLDLLRCLIEAPSLANPAICSECRCPPLQRRRASFHTRCAGHKAATAPAAATPNYHAPHSSIPRTTEEDAAHSLQRRDVKLPKLPSIEKSQSEDYFLDNLPLMKDGHVSAMVESDLKSTIERLKKAQLKVVENPQLANDEVYNQTTNRLWDLLVLRLSKHEGLEVAEIWKHIHSESLQLPVSGTSMISKGSLADSLWVPILELGFKDSEILKSICDYANELTDSSGKRWTKLYQYIMQHMLLNDRGSEAVYWHDILSDRHRPGPATFQRLMRNVIVDVSGKADLAALKEIYIRNPYRAAYSKVIPPLLQRQDFYRAFDWHMFLQYHGDLPLNADMVEPLVQYFAMFDMNTAKGISCGLTSSGSPLAPVLTKRLSQSNANSQDMMKLASGDAAHTESKLHNDKWGARWFATKWVTLDIAINTIHALKVNTIGPLSLQSIALREPRAADIARRIDQLQQRGISIGNSAYSKALASFAKRDQHELLQSLLESDQHPETFEDKVLQENLLISHARAGDWRQHQLILAVQLVSAIDPQMEEYNIQLRKYATERDEVAIVKTLETMRMKRIAVEVVTIRYILRSILRPRTRGHRPDLRVEGYVKRDTDLVISILKNIMEYNSFVPVTAWREVTRRLGMVGRITDLHSLSLWLADRYNHSMDGQTSVLKLNSKFASVRSQLSHSHPLHPLRLLFPDVRQRSIVEWSFIHGMMSHSTFVKENLELVDMTTPQDRNAQVLEKVTRGIYFLKELERHGVFINEANVRRAVYIRLVILYGPGHSNRVYNRAVRPYNPLSLAEMVRGVEDAWGRPLWPSVQSLQDRIRKERMGVAVLPGPRKATRLTGKMNLEMERMYGRFTVE